MGRVTAIAALATMAALAAAAPAAGAQRQVPPRFVGMVADGPLLDSPRVDLDRELDAMVAQGVESLRGVVDWSAAQPTRGGPLDWTRVDRLVVGAARRHMAFLPIVMIAPRWAARNPKAMSSPPRHPSDYARFVRALARRYGPHGTFWAARRDVPYAPVRDWQFWNEPSLEFYWDQRPWQRPYLSLLRAARRAVRGVDPHARIVLAGLPNDSWPALRSLYRHGARGLFDVVAVHPFTGHVRDTVRILQNVREVMRRRGDARKPIWVTELSWTSAGHRTEWRYGNETTEAGQARRLKAAMKLLAKRRRALRLERVYWYTWMTADRDPQYPFDYAGLSRLDPNGAIVRKPGFAALRQAALRLEGCAAKSGVADRCAAP